MADALILAEMAAIADPDSVFPNHNIDLHERWLMNRVDQPAFRHGTSRGYFVKVVVAVEGARKASS